MSIEVEAIYENGVLKLEKPVPLRNQQKVRVKIETVSDWVEESYGMFGWTGSAELAERIATDPDLDYPPPPEEP